MYFIIIGTLVTFGLFLLFMGVARKHNLLKVLGLGVCLLTAALFGSLNLLAEMLWFTELKFQSRFWTVILSQAGLSAAGALFGWLVVYLLTLPIPRSKKMARLWSRIAGAWFGALIGLNSWKIILLFLNQVSSGVKDPILGQDVSFYIFSLPFYDLIYSALLLFALISLAAAFAAVFLNTTYKKEIQIQIPDQEKTYNPVYMPVAAALLLFGWGQYLNRFHLMNSQLGIVSGPGWTDVNIRMPGYMIITVVSVLCALALLIPPVKRALKALAHRYTQKCSASNCFKRAPVLGALLLPPAVIGLFWALVMGLAPALAQWLRVEPNEITMESDYIGHNIKFTRYAFGVGDIQEREFNASEELTRETLDDNQELISEIRLWDWRVLADIYEQFQSIRLYYTFPDVDIDRYTIGNEYRQVMIAPREMDIGNLPHDSQTFVNKRFKYTHGYGLTMSTVREFTSEGLPNLMIKDIPPKSTHAELEVKQPQIYYGTLTDTPVVANTKEKEFDYPSGDKNVYTHYAGKGGVQLSSLWRKFIFGWVFDGTRFLLSGYPTPESRILFHRQVLDRVRRVAPFLKFETDPYIVLNNGRLYWIIDAYTTSDRLPYSEPFSAHELVEATDGRQRFVQNVGGQFRGDNYVRNSVKAVVDAYHGDVSFYVFDSEDPLIQTWQNIFPSLFKEMDDMPEGLRAHVRYPSTLLLTQGLVYTKYHMTDPAVFYNQEDLWVRSTEKYYQRVQPVEPYYVMWKLPDSEEPQFVLILPFSPKNKQIMIGWMAAMCDGQNYGRLLAYKFPKDKRILGPQQVETKIDQDRDLSGQLTLWDQRGSKVIRGNMLAIPLGDTLLYVEPIYLQAETAAYPELRLVAVMHNDNLSYAQTFDQALEGLFSETVETQMPTNSAAEPVATDMRAIIESADRAFNEYLRLQGDKKFTKAAVELEKLEEALKQLLNKKQEY